MTVCFFIFFGKKNYVRNEKMVDSIHFTVDS